VNLARRLAGRDTRADLEHVRTEHQRAVRESLNDMRELPVTLDRLGSRIILNVQRDIWG